MGRAKNLSVGGKGVKICHLYWESITACGVISSLPLAGASERPAGLRMTALEVFTIVYWLASGCQVNKQGSPHQALSFRAGPIRMGRAKNLPVGGKGAGMRRMWLETLPVCGGRSSLPLAGASEPPAGVRMTHAGRAELR